MRITRVTVDQMLQMERSTRLKPIGKLAGRSFGISVSDRRLNQAYFAFNGANADSPGGGAAGTDPVGPAVVELRSRSKSLVDFLEKISQMSSFAQLQAALGS